MLSLARACEGETEHLPKTQVGGRSFSIDVSVGVGYISVFEFGDDYKEIRVSKRFPRYYDGPLTTIHHIRQLLPRFLEDIGRKCDQRPDLVMAAWPEIVGQKFAPLAQAVSFVDGVLTVKVRDATLYSLLSCHDKPRLIQNLRDKFPGILIKTIFFRRG